MKLSEIAAAFMSPRPVWLVLGDAQVMRHLRDAVRFYCGFATLRRHPSEREIALQAGDEVTPDMDMHSPVDASNTAAGAQDFDLTSSEYAVIGPLFRLYVERENATALEASRGLGADPFGRSSSEIANDIAQLEEALPRKAFYRAVTTVAYNG